MLTNSDFEAFLGEGIPHGDPPGVLSSSAKSEECDPEAGLGSSSKSVTRELALVAAAGADSSGDVPNSDIMKDVYAQVLLPSMKPEDVRGFGHNRPFT